VQTVLAVYSSISYQAANNTARNHELS